MSSTSDSAERRVTRASWPLRSAASTRLYDAPTAAWASLTARCRSVIAEIPAWMPALSPERRAFSSAARSSKRFAPFGPMTVVPLTSMRTFTPSATLRCTGASAPTYVPLASKASDPAVTPPKIGRSR